MRVFPDEVSIWISRLSKADSPLQCGLALSKPLRTWTEQNHRGRKNVFSLPDRAVILLLPFNWDLHHWPFWFSGLQTLTGIYTIHFPGFLACRCQITRLLIFHNQVSQFVIKKKKNPILDTSYWFCSSKEPKQWKKQSQEKNKGLWHNK